jgi:hypothetical protein
MINTSVGEVAASSRRPVSVVSDRAVLLPILLQLLFLVSQNRAAHALIKASPADLAPHYLQFKFHYHQI